MGHWGNRLVTGAAAAVGIPAPFLEASRASATSQPGVEASLIPPGTLELASPWVGVGPELTKILASDVLGIVGPVVGTTRETAMQVPALARARHLLCGFGARAVLRAYAGDQPAAVQPPWMIKGGGGVPAFHRMLWTLDDLLFSGWSLWEVERDTDGGPITGTAQRVAKHRWAFEKDTGRVLLDKQPMSNRKALLIPGPHEGVLTFGRTAIVQAQELEAAATRTAQNPSAYLDLHYTGEVPLTDPEIDALIARWATARKGVNGGVSFTSKDVEAKELGAAAEHLLIDGRNAAAVNMARISSMPSAMVDATNAGASLTYETTAGRNGEFLDYGADLYLDAIAARLSEDDCVPAGERSGFDTVNLRTLTPAPAGAPRED